MPCSLNQRCSWSQRSDDSTKPCLRGDSLFHFSNALRCCFSRERKDLHSMVALHMAHVSLSLWSAPLTCLSDFHSVEKLKKPRFADFPAQGIGRITIQTKMKDNQTLFHKPNQISFCHLVNKNKTCNNTVNFDSESFIIEKGRKTTILLRRDVEYTGFTCVQSVFAF